MNPGLMIQVGRAGGTMAIAGASAASVSAATVIVATGGAAALVIVGCGVFQYFKQRRA